MRARLLDGRNGNAKLTEAIALLPTDMGNAQTSCIQLASSRSRLHGGWRCWCCSFETRTGDIRGTDNHKCSIRSYCTKMSCTLDVDKRTALFCVVLLDCSGLPCPVIASVTNATNDRCESVCLTDGDGKGDREMQFFNGCGQPCETTTPSIR